MTLQDLPGGLYEKFAELGQALADPTRLRILNRLCQTEHSVQELAELLGHSPANMSAHLQVLHRAHLVSRHKAGRRVLYDIASDQVLRLWLAIRDTALQELPEVREAMRQYASEEALLPDLSGDELIDRVRSGDVVLLDLRSEKEFDAGHIPQARSIPHTELADRIGELEPNKTIVAYCRGPWCVAAIESVHAMREYGLDAKRIPGGVAEWRAEGRQLEDGQK